MIFETERLEVRYLKIEDIEGYYKLQSDPLVLKYATGEIDTYEGIKQNLKEVIAKYTLPNNDFWIYAIEDKKTKMFLGTLALVKDEQNEDEIGYRFIREYWGNGYGYEICEGLIAYAKQIKITKLIGNVVNENVASAKILEKLNFKPVHQFVSKDIGLPETKYELKL
ncbi:GNAT family N-acetyltransferase [uncultured Tenacibaculum sp.]|uniref:GNAT family N-acetyltransferase n=1 Tax=uncultured Tenacibaculum sp. TaxID=174713 RepID=UPI002639535F|nr:GNAT family N-acetyltransferase [uncultured Tenacibaculum sp.]